MAGNKLYYIHHCAIKKRHFMLLTIKLHDISFYTLASAMLPCDLFEKMFREKTAPTHKYVLFSFI